MIRKNEDPSVVPTGKIKNIFYLVTCVLFLFYVCVFVR